MLRVTRKGKGPVTDVKVTHCGSIVLFHLYTPAAYEWVEEQVDPDVQMWGCALVVEHRFAHAIVQGMVSDGLRLV